MNILTKLLLYSKYRMSIISKIIQFSTTAKRLPSQYGWKWERSCGIPCNVPPCGQGIYIRWQQLIFNLFTFFICIKKTVQSCKYVGLLGHSSPHYWTNSSCADWNNHLSIYASYKLTAINNVTRCTSIHTFHITVIWPWTNMSATIHTSVPLHFYCSLNIISKLLPYMSKI